MSSDYELIAVPLSLTCIPALVLLSAVNCYFCEASKKVAGGGEEGPKLTWSARLLNHILVTDFCEVSAFRKLYLNIVLANIV